MRQKVFILGATGSVGTELIHQIITDDGIEKNANPTDIIGIANSKKMIISETALNGQITATRDDVKSLVSLLLGTGKDFTDMNEILEELKRLWHGGEVIIVDVTAAKGEQIREFHLDTISPKYGNKLVTANKNVVSLESQAVFEEVTGTHWIYDYNTAVMAGAGVVDFIERSKDIHDNVISIEGCFSWTLGYITSELEKWEKSFSEIVAEAKRLWYTEPNPWDDLNGLDVARKLLILARTADYKAEMTDIELEGFIGAKYAQVPENQFLEAIKAEDEDMAQKYKEALASGNTLKYVATMRLENGKPMLKVGLQEVEKTSSIGSLKWTNNIAKIETKRYAESRAWTLIAPWAGLDTTALAIRAGIANMLPNGLPRFNTEER